METCTYNSTCESLRKHLLQLGVSDELVETTCNGRHPCSEALTNVQLITRHLNVDNAGLVEEFVKGVFNGQLPVDTSPSALDQIFYRSPFYCSEIDTEIRQPCSVRSCSYWTNHAWARNCILYYRIDQHRDALDIKELAFLLDELASDLRRRANTVLAEMRRWALHTKIDQTETPLISGESTEDVCVVCGKPPETKPTYRQKFLYCSSVCLENVPPLELRIEEEFHLPIRRILQICVDSFAARRPMCHALNVTAKQLEKLCARHNVSSDSLSG